MDLAVLLYIGPIVALIGMFFCFPNQPRGSRVFGTLVAATGVAATVFAMARCFGLPVYPAVAVPAIVVNAWLAGRMVTHRAPVYSALYFGGVVLLTSVLALLVGAHFLAAILVIVYAGAILVAYVFVIMLAQRATAAEYDINVHQPVVALTVGAALVIAVILTVMWSNVGVARQASEPFVAPAAGVPTAGGNVVDLGIVLFGQYPITIEVAGVFLLIAMVGAIVLAGLRIAGNGGQQATDANTK